MTPEQRSLLERYADAVVQAPAALHLIAEGERPVFWQRHIEDAVQISQQLPPGKLLDLGSGNGIPGLPIAILQPERAVFMLDSDNKKCGFIDTFLNINEINNAHVLAGRAEELARQFPEEFPVVVARAFRKLPVTLELAAPFCTTGGEVFVPHGTSWEEAVRSSKTAIEALNLSFVSFRPYSAADRDFQLLHFKKLDKTPSRFPRRSGVAIKRPL
jgi:16S rRNA (guanine527-N7)-methyltransferase